MVVTKARRVPQQGSLPQAVAVLVGVVLTLVGGLSFVVTGFDDFAAHNPAEQLFGLAVNPLQNLLHLVVGLLGIVLSARLAWTRRYGWLLLAGFGAVFAYGVFSVQWPAFDVLNLDWAGNWLHLAAGLAGFLIAAGPARFGVRRGISSSRR
jgi:hypothetical protein